MFAWRALPPAGDGSPAGAGGYLTMPALNSAGIRAAFTTRHGGVGHGAFASLNLSLLAGDDPEVVRANRRRVLATLGAPADAWTSGRQVHEALVEHVDAARRGAGAVDPETMIPGTDALWTDEADTPLAVLIADCVPVLLADTERRRIGVVHAGWRGLVAGVIANAVDAIGASDGVVAFIGPSIGPCCYEVGDDVEAQAGDALGAHVIRRRSGARAHLDLWRGVATALGAAGVRDVRSSALCTRCEPHRFFSHRAGDVGRQALVAMIVDGGSRERARGRSVA